jgi:uncharacterized protein (DUF111 family)
VHSVDIRGELVTPTAAALLPTLSSLKTAGKMPAMRVLANGFGAGKKQFKTDTPNLLRVVIGETEQTDENRKLAGRGNDSVPRIRRLQASGFTARRSPAPGL